jgi:RNA polymerase sigma-70 factor, ECF subfamily
MMPMCLTLDPLGGFLSGSMSESRNPPLEELALLFARLSGGDLEALGPIYDRWAREIHSLALWRTGGSAEAGDVVQEVFVRLATTRAELGSVRDPRRYLLTMAHRIAVDRMRRRPRSVPLPETDLLEAAPHDPDRSLDARRASQLLLNLPPAQREAIYLRHFSDMGFREMGKVTGVPTFTVASRYRLGISSLRKLMGKKS